MIVSGITINIPRKDGRTYFKVQFPDNSRLLLSKTQPTAKEAIEDEMEGIAFAASRTFFRVIKQKRDIFTSLKLMNRLNRLYLAYKKREESVK